MWKEGPYEFPNELCCNPVPLIGLSGLDFSKVANHRTVWDTFCKNQNHLLYFKDIPPNHQFPVVKPKKPNFDRFIPKGILKKNWLRKHLLEIPAVLAVFIELNWDDPNYETKKEQSILQIKAAKTQLGGLGSKLAVILLQKNAPLPIREEGRNERAAELCAASEFSIKQLFVLPLDEEIQNYVIRLQHALLELAKVFYTQEIKHVKSHKDQLNKTTHKYLFVRHNFKLGFYCELKQDDRARDFYEVAYTHLKEVRQCETNWQEVKLLAGFVNYKLCSVMFRKQLPREAITQFNSHIKLYKSLAGPDALLFEHYAWLAAQYATFANLFDEAIRQGLTAIQTEHPGIYYRQAAQHGISRKTAAHALCIGEEPAYAVQLEADEFWGQRGWRAGKLAAEPLDAAAEREGVKALQAREKAFDHSAAIIGYLGSGVSQFKTYRCPRMRIQLLVQMAEQYHSAKNYGMALTVLTHMVSDYRNEHWWELLGYLLKLGLSSAFHSQPPNIPDYLSFLLEALSPHIPLEPSIKQLLYQNLIALINGETPTDLALTSGADIIQAPSLWAESAKDVTVDMSKVNNCLAVRVAFSQEQFQLGQPINFKLYLKSFLPGPVEISRAAATLAGEGSVIECESSVKNVMLDGGSVGVFDCCVATETSGGLVAGSKVSVLHVNATLGCVTIKLLPVIPASPLLTPIEFTVFRKIPYLDDWEPKEGFKYTSIAAPKAAVAMKIEHNSPALLNEQFPIDVNIVNSAFFPLYNAVLNVKLLAPSDETSPDGSTRLSDEQETSIGPRNIKVVLSTIMPSSTANARIFLRGYNTGERTLGFTVTYSLNEDVGMVSKVMSAVEEKTNVNVIQPFQVTNEYLSSKLEPADPCYAHEMFLLCTNVTITSPCPITIHQSSLELGLFISKERDKLTSHLAGVTLSEGECGRDIFPLVITEARAQPLAVGTYVLQWSREGSRHITSSTITLSAITCAPSVLSVDMCLPAHGLVRTPMSVVYSLYNRTPTLLQLDMHIDGNEVFLFSGKKQGQLRILPESERKLEYKLYPLSSGLLALPRLVLTSSDAVQDLTDQLTKTLTRSLPSHVYVMPQEKIGV